MERVETLCVREMTAADVEAVAVVRMRGWQWAYRGLMPQEYLDGLSLKEEIAVRREIFARTPPPVGNLVVERGGAVVGWAAFGPYRESGDGAAASGAGEVYALYVLPEHIGSGVGRALIGACMERLRDRGVAELLLWVAEGNVRARRFYERAGFAADGAEEGYEVGGVTVPEVRYGRPLLL